MFLFLSKSNSLSSSDIFRFCKNLQILYSTDALKLWNYRVRLKKKKEYYQVLRFPVLSNFKTLKTSSLSECKILPIHESLVILIYFHISITSRRLRIWIKNKSKCRTGFSISFIFHRHFYREIDKSSRERWGKRIVKCFNGRTSSCTFQWIHRPRFNFRWMCIAPTLISISSE